MLYNDHFLVFTIYEWKFKHGLELGLESPKEIKTTEIYWV